MSKIMDIIKNEKVEWRKLGEVLESITTGLNPRKNFILNDSNGELTSWYITTKDYSQNEEIEFIEGKTARITETARIKINQRSKLQKGDLLFSAVGTVGKIALVKNDPNNFDVNESTFVLKPKRIIINERYLLHYLKNNIFQNNLKNRLKGSTLSGIRKGDLENFEIPVPSIETQEKIVKILDKFTNYVT
ncbi:MAG: restriction endonuclease subunit S, partial [Fusobacterium sp.]|uniref:restriction endonuclease subunit S n=1 Tax=Fusobacterium sp. TaxID=68766 RepID=UPI0026DC324F